MSKLSSKEREIVLAAAEMVASGECGLNPLPSDVLHYLFYRFERFYDMSPYDWYELVLEDDCGQNARVLCLLTFLELGGR